MNKELEQLLDEAAENLKDNDFVEEHTGLEDCGIEYQILLKSFKSGYKIESEPQNFVYKKFLPFL